MLLVSGRDKNPRGLEIVRSGLFSIVPSVVRVTDIFPGLTLNPPCSISFALWQPVVLGSPSFPHWIRKIYNQVG
jgi:hypothetical protein